jgi:formylmethanofuran dehydrogenase subunit A
MLPNYATVTLTTSQNIAMCPDPKIRSTLQERTIPICVAEYRIKNKLDYKKMEPFFHQSLFELCGDVFIDVDNKIVRINERQGNHYLIEATFENANNIQKSFFEYYKKYSVLLFEYQVFLRKKIKISLRGFWVKNKWVQLKIYHKNFIHIIPISSLN